MRRISPSNAVRRRLFPADDVTEEAKIDNFSNILQESIKRDVEEKSKKWNFDFAREVPLEGKYEWFHCRDTWIGAETEVEEVSDNFLAMKFGNEMTPKSKNKEDTIALLVRKRKIDSKINDKGVRRKISFD